MESCSENNFRNFFQNNADFLFILDREGNIIETNNAAHNILGYSDEDLIGKNVLQLHPSQYREEVGEAVRQMLAGEKTFCQIPLQSKNKECIPVETIGIPGVWNSEPSLIVVCRNMTELKFYLLTSITEITAQKKAELKVESLFRQQKLLSDVSQLLNTTTNLECVLDDVLKLIGEHTKISRVTIFENLKNENAGKVTHEWCNSGINPLIMINQERVYEGLPSWKKLLLDEGCIYSNNIEELPGDLYQTLKLEHVKTILVYPLYVQNVFYGSISFQECVSTQSWLKEEIDLLRTVSNIISNALERKRVLTKLEKSETRLKLALDSAQECLWDLDIKTGLLFLSDIWYKKLGYDVDEMKHTFSSWQKLIHPEDLAATLALVHKHFQGETELYEATYRVETKDGKWLWVLDHGMVVEWDADKKPVRAIGTSIDITNQKEIELQLKRSLDTQYKLFSIIAHDLRGPIGNTLPIVEILTDCKELNEASRGALLKELNKSAKNTYDLLDNLLNWSRSQTNSISLRPVSFDLIKIIKKNVDLLACCANQKKITISIEMPDGISAYADVDTISSVFRNLMSNAIKFTPNEGTISISAFDNGSQIEVEIADNGVGMEKDVVKTLFSSNQFNSTNGTNNEKGSGLGLVLCKDFVERNGGQIRVESTFGEGCKFNFTIPGIKTDRALTTQGLSKKNIDV